MNPIDMPRHTRPFSGFCIAAYIVASTFSTHGYAQAAKPAAPPPSAPPAAAATPAVPQQTTASFADWTLRCTRSSPTGQICEVVQTITSQERTVAQIAFGRVGKGQPLHLTVLAPTSVTFTAAPTLTTMRDGDPPVVEMAWRRCLPGGCVADGTVPEETLRRVRGWTDPARIVFADGAGRSVALPFSPKGLQQALDALTKEDAG